MLIAPDGERRVRIRPREQYPRRLRDIVTEVASDVPHSRVEIAGIERFATAEGELACLAVAKICGNAQNLYAAVAVVGDRPFACFDALGDESVGALVRALVNELGLGLGVHRRRWFLYEPPRDWIGLRRGECAIWLHPAYPRVSAMVAVFDARMFRDDRHERLDHELFLRIGGAFAPIGHEVCDVQNAHALNGRLLIVHGETSVRAVAALTDDTFVYFAHLQAPDTTQLDAFRDVIASFAPLPGVSTIGSMNGIWAD